MFAGQATHHDVRGKPGNRQRWVDTQLNMTGVGGPVNQTTLDGQTTRNDDHRESVRRYDHAR